MNNLVMYVCKISEESLGLVKITMLYSGYFDLTTRLSGGCPTPNFNLNKGTPQ